MGKKACRRAGALVCAALLFATPLSTRAAGGVIGLSPDAENLFFQMSDMMPGEHYSDIFTVTNLGKAAYTFYLQAESAAECDFEDNAKALTSCEKLLQELEMWVTIHRDSSVREYSGKANQIDCHDDSVAMIGRRIVLGTLEPGQSVLIEAAVEVPLELDNAHNGMTGKFWWNFTAMTPGGQAVDELRPGDEPGLWEMVLAPQTGDDRSTLLWLVLLLVSAALLAAGIHHAKKKGGAA